jgi:glycine hydroxymethyltransferase
VKDGLKNYRRVKQLVLKHERWFSECLPLVASENLASRAAREVLSSDMGQRYAEGRPGERIYAGCKFMDGIEEIAVSLAKRLFKADFADVRPVSGLTANLAVYSTLTKPGDRIMSLATYSGGHISSAEAELGGSAGMVRGLTVEHFEFDERRLNIDIEGSIRKIKRLQMEGKSPRMLTFGASLFLFPHPVKELSAAARESGAVVLYDAAHVAGLVAGGQFQDPLREGADLMTFSTHKTLFGPQGGAIVGKGEFSDYVSRGVFPGVTSNHHPQLVAAKAVAFAEYLEFGTRYAKDVIMNARALAEALSDFGERLLGEDLGFTASHQLVLLADRYGGGIRAEKLLESMNIITNRQTIPKASSGNAPNPEGVRLGVAEITRLGFRKSDMKDVAKVLHLALNGYPRKSVLDLIRNLRKETQDARYTFEKSPAYFYTP